MTGAAAFTVLQQAASGPARLGQLNTPHGPVETPQFMPVGTRACVRTLAADELAEAGVRIILANTYHLLLRPGPELIQQAGGLHRFMGWAGPILTDSGGFQVFSLAPLRRVSDEGVLFRSHVDGSLQWLTPRRAMEAQWAFGSDVSMVLDECVGFPATRTQVEQAVRRTAQWARECVAVFRELVERHGQLRLVFAINQGGVFRDLRRRSLEELLELPVDGLAVGGLSVGEPKPLMYEVLEELQALLPPERPRYVMGLGSPDVLVEAVARGYDLFDSVLPTRMARHGAVWTWEGRRSLKDAASRDRHEPIEEGCDCYTCRRFTRAYVRHLLKSGEVLGMRLATVHNVRFMMRLMDRVRQAIRQGQLEALREEIALRFGSQAGKEADGT
ncbi:MAG TPA: tRNA guanosine(34) transglycosylase Tgt [Limnochordales bacterium]